MMANLGHKSKKGKEFEIVNGKKLVKQRAKNKRE